MFASCRKLFRFPVAHRKTFCSIVEEINSEEFKVYSPSEVLKKNFKVFNVHNCCEIGSGDDWVDYRDIKDIEFRKARYVHPPKDWVSVHINSSTEEYPDLSDLRIEGITGTSISTSSAVKRSDKGVLLNSCAIFLGLADILTARCEGAYLGMLMAECNEKVQLCTDSIQLKDLLESHDPVPKACQEIVGEIRSMICDKHRQGGVVNVKLVDRIANFLSHKMSQLPCQHWWHNTENSPIFFKSLEDLPDEELKTIILEDMEEIYRYAKKEKTD